MTTTPATTTTSGCGPRPPTGAFNPPNARANDADGGAPARRRLLRNADSGRRGTWTCVIDVRKTPEDVRVTDHALILRLPPHALRASSGELLRRAGRRRRRTRDGDGFRYLRVSVHVRGVGDEKSAPGVGHPARGKSAPARAVPRVVEGGRRRRRRGFRGRRVRGRRGRVEPNPRVPNPRKKRVALVIDGFTHLAHRARPGRCFEAFGVPRPPGSNRRWGVGGAEWGAEWEDDVIHAHHRNKATHLRARYRARRGFRGENNGAHSPGAHFGVNYGARGCPYALVGRVGASASAAGGRDGSDPSPPRRPSRTFSNRGSRRTSSTTSPTGSSRPCTSRTRGRLRVAADLGDPSRVSAVRHPPVSIRRFDSITDSPAVVVDRHPRPRHVDPDVLVFKVTGGAASRAMSILERLDERDVLPRPGFYDDRWGSVRCHLVFTHRTGRAFVSAPALAAASYVGQGVGTRAGAGQPSGPLRRDVRRSPRWADARTRCCLGGRTRGARVVSASTTRAIPSRVRFESSCSTASWLLVTAFW